MTEQNLGTGRPEIHAELEPRSGSAATQPMMNSVNERLLRRRIILLGQRVDDDIANRIAGQMLLLTAEDPEAEISLYVNSPGGSLRAGMVIFDTMRFIECEVATYGIGLAASMGQFLLSAGTPGKRYALPHCQIVMHQPAATVAGAESDVTPQAEQCDRDKRDIAELIAGHTGQPVERIIADFDGHRWFSAWEALEYGLVDHVVSRAD